MVALVHSNAAGLPTAVFGAAPATRSRSTPTETNRATEAPLTVVFINSVFISIISFFLNFFLLFWLSLTLVVRNHF
jgi:hypothetical protein